MHLVLMTFTLIFAILRVTSRVSSDTGGNASIRLRGTLEEWMINDCSSELEEKYTRMLDNESQYDEVWDILEDFYQNHQSVIMSTKSANKYSTINTPERNKEIWDQLMKYGRRPIGRYSTSFRRERGMKGDGGAYLTMTDAVNNRRALWCLMSMHGKFPEWDVEEDWRCSIDHRSPKGDSIRTFDEIDWEYGLSGKPKEKKW